MSDHSREKTSITQIVLCMALGYFIVWCFQNPLKGLIVIALLVIGWELIPTDGTTLSTPDAVVAPVDAPPATAPTANAPPPSEATRQYLAAKAKRIENEKPCVHEVNGDSYCAL